MNFTTGSIVFIAGIALVVIGIALLIVQAVKAPSEKRKIQERMKEKY